MSKKTMGLQLAMKKIAPTDGMVTFLLLQLERKTCAWESCSLCSQPNYTCLKHLVV